MIRSYKVGCFFTHVRYYLQAGFGWPTIFSEWSEEREPFTTFYCYNQ